MVAASHEEIIARNARTYVSHINRIGFVKDPKAYGMARRNLRNGLIADTLKDLREAEGYDEFKARNKITTEKRLVRFVLKDFLAREKES